jgi:hypothetical protein
MGQSIGGEANRDGGPAPNWGGRTDGWDQGATKEAPTAPTSTEGSEPDAGGKQATDAGTRPAIDDDDRERYANYIKAGLTPQAAAYQLGLNDEELASLQGTAPPAAKAAPKTPRQSVERELAAIAKLRREDSHSYWGDEKLQQRERELLAARTAAKAEALTTNAAPVSTTSDADKRLEEIRKLRATNSEAYWKSTAIQEEELRLLEARATASEGASENAQLQSFIDAVRGSLEDATELESSFDAMFPTLASEVQDRVRQEIRSPTEPTRPATTAEIASFTERAEGAQLVAEWGAHAPQRIAQFQTRVRALAAADTSGKLAAWFAERTPEQAAAVARALAGR